MSAYMVEDNTINNIVSYLDKGQGMDLTRVDLDIFLNSDEAKQAFGQSLFDMNCEAVDSRYGEGESESFRDMTYRFTRTLPQIAQAYQSTRCLIYQCSEGDVPESSLFKQLTEISNVIAHKLARSHVDKLDWK